MWDGYIQYLSLPQNEEDESKSYVSRYSLLKATVVRWSFAVILLCAIIDSCALIYVASRLAFASAPQAKVSSDGIPFRSTYVNLDQFYLQRSGPSEPRPSVINFPHLSLAQVTRNKPEQVYPQPSDSWINPNGIIPFGYRRLLVNSEISTISQFRVMDYGMGNCSIAINVPPESISIGNMTTAIEGAQNGDAAEVDVWLLSTGRKIDLATMSWAKKPARASHLGTLSLSYGTTRSLSGFPCASGTYYSFEISCQDCLVDITGVQRHVIGLYMVQYQTI